MLVYSAVLDFFSALINHDKLAIELMANPPHDMQFIEGSFVFTLAALHKVLMPENQLSYKEFRQALYASPLNNELKTLGYKISVYANTTKVDSNRYQLEKL